MSEKAQSNRPLTHQIVLVLLVLLLIAESFRFDSHIFFIYLLPWIVLEVEAVIKKANTSEEGRQACACLHHTHTHTVLHFASCMCTCDRTATLQTWANSCPASPPSCSLRLSALLCRHLPLDTTHTRSQAASTCIYLPLKVCTSC